MTQVMILKGLPGKANCTGAVFLEMKNINAKPCLNIYAVVQQMMKTGKGDCKLICSWSLLCTSGKGRVSLGYIKKGIVCNMKQASMAIRCHLNFNPIVISFLYTVFKRQAGNEVHSQWDFFSSLLSCCHVTKYSKI